MAGADTFSVAPVGVRRVVHWPLGVEVRNIWGSARQAPRSGSGLLATYIRRGEGTRVIGEEGHLGTIKAFLEKDPILKIDRRLCIVVESQVILVGIALRLRRRAADCFDPAPPFLFGKLEDRLDKKWT